MSSYITDTFNEKKCWCVEHLFPPLHVNKTTWMLFADDARKTGSPCNWIHVKMAVRDDRINDRDLSDSNAALIVNHGPATAHNHCFDISEPAWSISWLDAVLTWLSSLLQAWTINQRGGIPQDYLCQQPPTLKLHSDISLSHSLHVGTLATSALINLPRIHFNSVRYSYIIIYTLCVSVVYTFSTQAADIKS